MSDFSQIISEISKRKVEKQEDLSDDDIKTILKDVESLGDEIDDHGDLFKMTKEMCVYEGFNHGIILRALIAKGGKDLKKDMSILIALFLSRGTSVTEESRASTIPPAFRELVKTLVTRYGIKKNTSGDPKADKSKIITLSRIAAVFPYMTAKYLQEIKPARPFSISNFVALIGSEVSCNITFLGILGLIKNVKDKDGFILMVIWYQVMCSRVINGRKSTMTYQQYFDSTFDYATAVINSSKLISYSAAQLDSINVLSSEGAYAFVKSSFKKWAEQVKINSSQILNGVAVLSGLYS